MYTRFDTTLLKEGTGDNLQVNIQEILPAGGLTEIKDDKGGTKRMSSSQVVMDCITHRSELRKHSLC